CCSDDRRDSRGLGALRALHDLVADPLSFLQATEALGTDRRVVHEHAGAAVFRGDEAEPLGVVEPLHCAVLHELCDLVWMRCVRLSAQAHVAEYAAPVQPCKGGCSTRARSNPATPAVAAATLDSTSSRVITSSGSGP